MKILLLGKNGQVGWELQRALAPVGELIALDRHAAGGLCGNLADEQALRSVVQSVKPNVIVNAAAYTAVDKAEVEVGLAYQINAKACQILAEEAVAAGAWLVHYSTDYVFDGTGNVARAEAYPVGPLNQYGITKLAGEQFIQSSGCKHLILRTSWVYAARGDNFAKTMLRLAGERETLKVIADQVGAPTGAELIADVTAHVLKEAISRPEVSGIYHLAAAGEVSWYDYAQYVVSVVQKQGVTLAVKSIEPISTTEYPTPARRPQNCRLNTQKLRETFSISLPDWRAGVNRMLMEVLQK